MLRAPRLRSNPEDSRSELARYWNIAVPKLVWVPGEDWAPSVQLGVTTWGKFSFRHLWQRDAKRFGLDLPEDRVEQAVTLTVDISAGRPANVDFMDRLGAAMKNIAPKLDLYVLDLSSSFGYEDDDYDYEVNVRVVPKQSIRYLAGQMPLPDEALQVEHLKGIAEQILKSVWAEAEAFRNEASAKRR